MRGKFLYAGGDKLFVRGVTYGPFRPREGSVYPDPECVARDFKSMRARGINAVRTYTSPPRWLLDMAWQHGLYVMVGLAWEQHVAFLEDRACAARIERTVRRAVAEHAGHPAVLCYAVGNEIPSSIVRWHGRRRVERFVERLSRAVREEDPAGLVTYVNYPTTEYLQLPFLDLVAFNVYLEEEDAFGRYLARLHHLAGDRPLVMAEIGLDSDRNGEETQARTLGWQIRRAFATGCAGAFAFSWTDEWHRGGHDVVEWSFGLTDRARRPKPALKAVQEAFASASFAAPRPWPRISVVVCTYNGAATLGECLDAVQALAYPDFEVIVVDDGSTDASAEIAGGFGARVIRTENRGLSAARNTGMEAASGDIVAYLDDDAFPDPHWLHFLAVAFQHTSHAAMGGPNLAPPGDGLVAEAVDGAPGNPTHVMLSDDEAEHLPGCNMAVRRDVLRRVGGFDPRFRIAGDDVDLSWRLQHHGYTLGFTPAAVVWHHRRGTIRTFWRQQLNYGRAEALLEAKWPHKYNWAGHLRWRGRVYEHALVRPPRFPGGRIYYGVWGSGLFQSIEASPPGLLRTLPLLPEWYLIVLAFGVAGMAGVWWPPMGFGLLLCAAVLVVVLVQAAASAVRASSKPRRLNAGLRQRGLTAFFHLMQPLARLVGRLQYGLSPWRRQSAAPPRLRRSGPATVWSERWHASGTWLTRLESALERQGVTVRRGGSHDRWDLEVGAGVFGTVRLLMAVEEHGTGRQLVRFRIWPRWPLHATAPILVLAALAAFATADAAWSVGGSLGLLAMLGVMRGVWDCAAAREAVARALEALRGQASQPDEPDEPGDAFEAPEHEHGREAPRRRRVER